MNEENTKKSASTSLVIIGFILIGIWLLASAPLRDGNGNSSLFHILMYGGMEIIFFPILLLGIFLFVLGLLRKLRASWSKKNKV